MQEEKGAANMGISEGAVKVTFSAVAADAAHLVRNNIILSYSQTLQKLPMIFQGHSAVTTRKHAAAMDGLVREHFHFVARCTSSPTRVHTEEETARPRARSRQSSLTKSFSEMTYSKRQTLMKDSNDVIILSLQKI